MIIQNGITNDLHIFSIDQIRGVLLVKLKLT